MEKKNTLEKLKIHTSFQLQTLRGRGILGDLDLEEMLRII
jgi:hypothetical protein